jgi:hypothetical protein
VRTASVEESVETEKELLAVSRRLFVKVAKQPSAAKHKTVGAKAEVAAPAKKVVRCYIGHGTEALIRLSWSLVLTDSRVCRRSPVMCQA